jgi:hypothetical protein
MLPVPGASTRQKTIENYTFDHDPIGNPNDLVLYAYGAGSGGTFGTFRLPGATSGYAVPAGKTLKILGVEIMSFQGANGAWFAQSDIDSGIGSATAPTNPVYVTSAGVESLHATGVGAHDYFSCFFSVATGKYFTSITSAVAGTQLNFKAYAKLV